MKIAIPAKEKTIESITESRFGRANYFIIFDTVANSFNCVENKQCNAVSGAGGQTVRQLSELDVETILLPEVGPKALEAIKSFDIKAYRYTRMCPITDLIQQFKEDKLESVLTESHGGYHGAQGLYKV